MMVRIDSVQWVVRLVCLVLMGVAVGSQSMSVSAQHGTSDGTNDGTNVVMQALTMQPPVEVVNPVDLERYDGLWYELSSTPSFFNKSCHCTTAHYSIESDEAVGVFNACNRFWARGPLSTIAGTATLVGEGAEGKLRVVFDKFAFPGDYWIIDVVEDWADPNGEYRFAAVGGPNRDYIFILARDPILDSAEEIAGYQSVLDELESQLFDISALITTPQPFLCQYDERIP